VFYKEEESMIREGRGKFGDWHQRSTEGSGKKEGQYISGC
jgi:hypothetical protein